MKNFDILAIFILFFLTSCSSGSTKSDTKSMVKTQKSYTFSLAQWSLHREIETGKLDPFDFPRAAKELGFEAVEWVSHLYEKEIDILGLDAVVERWKAETEKYGIANVLIMVDGAGDLSTSNPTERDKAIEMHKKYVDAAAYLGGHSIRINTFGTYNVDQWITNTEDSLKKLGTYAASKNINVLAENHGWYSSDPRVLIPVIEKVNLDNVGTLADFGNWCIKRVQLEDWGECAEEYPDKYEGFKRLMTKAKAVSAKAYEFDEYGNETSLDFQRFVQIIKDSGYDNYISIEYEHERLNERDGIKKTKALLEKSINQLK